MKTRRDFLNEGLLATAGLAVGGCASAPARAPAIAGDFAWGALLHLGTNIAGDWVPGVRNPQSAEEEAELARAGKISYKHCHISCLRDFFSTDWTCWRQQLEGARQGGLNTVFIDVAEAYAYPGHPELWVKGSLDFDRMRQVLDEIRGMGLEPIPKLNFSTGHDQWLREYHYRLSTPEYYRVVADVIRETCKVFGGPRLFHLGFDEEVYIAMKRRQFCAIRRGDLWWKDFLYCVGEVERNGARAMCWSDKICGGREEFLKRMPKSVLQVPWYYGTDFSAEYLTWQPEFEKSLDWKIQRNLAASILTLADAGYDVMPCTSNFKEDGAADAMVGFCKSRIDPARLKGIFMSFWHKPCPEDTPMVLNGLRLFADAKRRHYGCGK